MLLGLLALVAIRCHVVPRPRGPTEASTLGAPMPRRSVPTHPQSGLKIERLLLKLLLKLLLLPPRVWRLTVNRRHQLFDVLWGARRRAEAQRVRPSHAPPATKCAIVAGGRQT